MASFKELTSSSTPTLVDFFATWCGPCKTLAPILKDLKKELGESVTILKVDVDKNPKAAQKFGVRGVPLLILFKNGDIVWKESGVRPMAELKEIILPHTEAS
jgi:thioredoxin 1